MLAECWRIDPFEPVVLERTLESPWTARRSNQSILKEINPEYSLEGLILKLKLQYFGHLMQRADLLEKTLMLGKIEGRRTRDNRGQDVGWSNWFNEHEFKQALGDGEGQGSLACCSPRSHQESDATEQLNNKTPRPPPVSSEPGQCPFPTAERPKQKSADWRTPGRVED